MTPACRACIVSVLRFRTLELSTTSTDPTWDKVPSGFYGLIECNLGVICACVVTLRPLFHRLRRLLFGHKTLESEAESPPHRARRRTSPYEVTFSSVGGTHVGSDNQDAEPGEMDKTVETRTISTVETVVAGADAR